MKSSKSSSPPPAPAPPAVQSLTPEQVYAQTRESSRAALEQELEFRPEFREQDIQDILQLGAADAELQRTVGFDLERDSRALAEELEPESFSVFRKLASQLEGQLGQPLSPELESAYQEKFRAEEAAGGRLGGPLSSATIARNLIDVTEANRSRAQNASLSFLGRVPSSDPSGLAANRGVNMGGLVGPQLGAANGIFGAQAGIYGSQIGAYNAGLGYRQNSNAGRNQMLGSALGAAGQIGAAALPLMFCLPKDALIDTPWGPVPVKDIQVGEEVVGGTVIATIMRQRYDGHRFYDHKFTTGTVTMSAGHPSEDTLLELTVSDNKSKYTYDILTTEGWYKVNGVTLRSTIQSPEVAEKS